MNFRKGNLYKITFLDHCISPDHEVVTCEVVGWLLSQDKTRITITYWKVIHDDSEIVDSNNEPVNIIKSTILEATKL